jgi:hypothetical protein
VDYKNLPTVNGVDVALITDIPSGSGGVDPTPLKVITSAAQTVSANTNTKIVFGTIEINSTGAQWLSATNRFVASVAGIYEVRCSLRFTGTARPARMNIYKNGVLFQAIADYTSPSLNTPFVTGNTFLDLALNDYIEIWLFSTSSTVIASSRDSNLCISRLR